MELTFEEVRVLGCLVEKSANTPEHYPLTSNALRAACNQKTSREPVVAFSAREVDDTVMLLRQAGLARSNMSGRASKHRHVIEEALDITENQAVVLSVMMLRGPQSAGELKTRTDRSIGFTDSSEVDRVLQSLAESEDPLVKDVGRGSGQSMNRWAHLLGGDDQRSDFSDATTGAEVGAALDNSAQLVSQTENSNVARPSQKPSPGPTTHQLLERIDALERRLATLEAELGIGPQA